LLSHESILLLVNRGRFGYRANSSGLHNGIFDLRSVRTKVMKYGYIPFYTFLFFIYSSSSNLSKDIS